MGVCVCPRQTVLRVGGLDSRGGRCYSVATAKEVRVARGTVTGNVSEGDELTKTEVAQANNEAGPRGGIRRPDETSGISASDGSTTEDDSEVQCNLKAMNEQQRTTLRKSGKQLFVDESDQLTTSEAGHTDLAEIGNVGEGELLSACELLGGRTLRISRDTGCDLLTREVSSGAASLLTDNCPTVSWFHPSPSRPKLQRIQTSSPPNSQLPQTSNSTHAHEHKITDPHTLFPLHPFLFSFPLSPSSLSLLHPASRLPHRSRHPQHVALLRRGGRQPWGGSGSLGEEGSLLSLSPFPFPEI